VFGRITLEMILVILPEILMVILGLLILALDLVYREKQGRSLGWWTAGGLAVIFVISVLVARPGVASKELWGGMVRFDWLGFTFNLLFIFGAAITSLFSMEIKQVGNRGEFYLLLLVATIGMSFMAISADMIMLFLAIETTSIPLYILAGFLKTDNKSTESGFKYLLFGAMTSAIMLYGFSLLFAFAGTTSIYQLTQGFMAGDVPQGLVLGALLLILVGFGFKISMVPLHFWAPDVYEGAPTPVAGYLSTASKAAGFAILMRVLIAAFPMVAPTWVMIIAVVSVATMTIGNAIALAQKNIKRMLAYSSIAHAGYVLIGIAAVSVLGTTSAIFYLIIYVITNLAAFGIVAAFSRVSGSDEISDYAALSRRSPWLALAMLIAFLSLAGMPPFGGFVAKVLVFAAAVKSEMVWLAIIGVLNAIIGLYYYLIVLKVVYLYRSEDEDKPVPMTRPYTLALAILIIGIILAGTIFAPLYLWSDTAAAALF